MRSPEKAIRHIVRCDWRCKHCRQLFGTENVSHYGAELPEETRPTWFFASMALLDHLRDCQHTDLSETLRHEFGADFLNHPRIYDWYNIHALIERKLIAEEDLD